MKVLMITGDRNFSSSSRYELQRSVVDALEVIYWGHGSWWPKIPNGNFDVVTAQDPFWRGFVAWLISQRIGAKLNLQVHTDLSAQPFCRRILAHFLIQQADSVRAVSEKIKEQVQKINGKILVNVLPIYVDINHFKNLELKLHKQKTILWIGRFESEKDPIFAIHVLEEVRKNNIDAKLIMLGAGSLELQLKKLAKKLPIEFPGWHDPARYLQIADVVLCTSKHESWGASIVESLSIGVPVVAPDVGIAKEAGAIVVARSNIAKAVVDVLNSGERGELKISLPNEQEWAKLWKETLGEDAPNISFSDVPKVVRYIISGSTGAIINIGTLFTLTHFFAVWYLTSSIIAFLLGFLVSFSLQRMWTFNHRTINGLARHTVLYFVAAIGNTLLNAILVFGLVEHLQVWYVVAQIISGALISTASFFVYKRIFV